MPDDKPRKARGPGFILGTLIGALAGAAAAILLSPPGREGDEPATQPATAPEEPSAERPPAYMTSSEDESLARVRAMLERVRARMREASDAGREAAQEQEESMTARYAELTQRDRPGAPPA
jgi:gas vesicle protein